MVQVPDDVTGSPDGARGRVGEPLDDATVWALVDAAPDGLVMADEQGLVLLVNRKVEELFGYDRAELVGQPVEMLIPDRLRAAHRAHRTRFRAEARARAMGAGLPLFGRHSNGAEFPVEISLSPLRTSAGLRVIAAVRDVSERLAVEAQAREIQRVLDATSDAVLMFHGETLAFTYVNEGAINQLGYSRQELLGMTPLHIKPDFTEAAFRELIAAVAPGTSHTYTTLHRRKDGRDILVEAVLQRPPEDADNPSGWMISIARDLTARVEVERRANAAEREVAVLEDRQRIASDLHDTVIQRLFAVGLGIEAVTGRVNDPVVSERLAQAVTDLDETIRQLRSAIFELGVRSPTRTLRILVLDVCADEQAALGFDPDVRFEGPIDTVDDAVAEHLLAVLREALSNIARHADATRTEVTITVDDQLGLRVEDNGTGLADGARDGSGNGLANMAARATKLGGTCQLVPAVPTGTILGWRVPLG